MTDLEEVLIKRDCITRMEAKKLIKDAYDAINDYEDVDDFMADWFGLEPDYIFDVWEIGEKR